MNDVLSTAEVRDRWINHPTVKWVVERNPDLDLRETLLQLSDVLNGVEEAFPGVPFSSLFPKDSEPMRGKGVRQALINAGVPAHEAAEVARERNRRQTEPKGPERFTSYPQAREDYLSGKSFTELADEKGESWAKVVKGLDQALTPEESAVLAEVHAGNLTTRQGAENLGISTVACKRKVLAYMWQLESTFTTRRVSKLKQHIFSSKVAVGLLTMSATAALGHLVMTFGTVPS